MTDEPRRTMYIARATQVLEKVDEKKLDLLLEKKKNMYIYIYYTIYTTYV